MSLPGNLHFLAWIRWLDRPSEVTVSMPCLCATSFKTWPRFTPGMPSFCASADQILLSACQFWSMAMAAGTSQWVVSDGECDLVLPRCVDLSNPCSLLLLCRYEETEAVLLPRICLGISWGVQHSPGHESVYPFTLEGTNFSCRQFLP